MADIPPSGQRLDSWKAIADYLRRDVATVRRWEKSQRLPVRRVPGGTGRSVFAFTSEIDAWLTANDATRATQGEGTAAPSARRRWLPPAAAAAALAIPVTWMVMRPAPIKPSELRLDVSPAAAVAYDAQGRERWRYTFPSSYKPAFPDETPWRIVEGPPPAVYLATASMTAQGDGTSNSGTLSEFDLDGHLQHSFAFDDRVKSGDRTLGAPWAITAFAVRDGAARRVAVAAHHYVWNPGLVTLLDDQWKRHGTYVNDGWIEDVRWISHDRLLVSGFSNAQDGGLVALLDANTLEHASGSAPVTPLRVVIMPRTELNRVTASAFNRAVLQLEPDRIVARTIEVPAAAAEAIDAIYEFTPALDVIAAHYSDRYWEAHRALEAQGKLDRPRNRLPDRNGPISIRVWEPATGWKTVPITPKG